MEKITLKDLVEDIAYVYSDCYHEFDNVWVSDVTEPDEPDPIFAGTFTELLEHVRKHNICCLDERYDAWIDDMNNNHIDIYVRDEEQFKSWYGYDTDERDTMLIEQYGYKCYCCEYFGNGCLGDAACS